MWVFVKKCPLVGTLMVQDTAPKISWLSTVAAKYMKTFGSVISGYDPRVRPWYTPVVNQKKPCGRQFTPMPMNAKRSPVSTCAHFWR
ncbi:hypothetical protein O9992_09885 [Vibrio lentus]|nr:hypothetical protein [Vibrio lentus]